MTTTRKAPDDRSIGDRSASITDTVDHYAGRYGPVAARWILGLMWLSNVNWKVPTEFGGLENYIQAGVDNQVVPGSSWAFEQLVLPAITPFGYLTLVLEVGVAALLLSGRFLRVAAVVSFVQSLAIGLAVANAPEEWYWSYLLMMGLSIAVLVQARRDRPTSPRTIAIVVALTGLVTLVHTWNGGFGGDNTASKSIFTGRQDIPDEFGNAIFPGSIALGLILIILGIAAWALASGRVEVRRTAGWAMVAVATVLLFTYTDSPDTLLIGLGSLPVHCGILATVGLCLLPWSRRDHENGRDGEPASASRT